MTILIDYLSLDWQGIVLMIVATSSIDVKASGAILAVLV